MLVVHRKQEVNMYFDIIPSVLHMLLWNSSKGGPSGERDPRVGCRNRGDH
jgi:hypothetical protein